MDATQFRNYIEIAKELGVSRFKIEDNRLEVSFSNQISTRPIELEELMKDIPSDEKLLGIEEPPAPKSLEEI